MGFSLEFLAVVWGLGDGLSALEIVSSVELSVLHRFQNALSWAFENALLAQISLCGHH